MMRLLFGVFVLLVFCSCQKETFDVQQLIDKTMEVSGGDAYATFDMEFDFRDKHYRIKRDGGTFQYERQFQDSIGQIKDVVGNNGFVRYVDDSLVKVSDSMAVKYTSSVNSVQYFTLLPFGLNDAAVNKRYLEKQTIKGKDYHKIEVTFNEEGGGEDFEDVFIYWINAETHKIDYLAYSYNEEEGIGKRFREAFNERYIRKIRFVDYNNYKAKPNDAKLEDLDTLFENGQLELVSKIENKNIKVN